MPTHRKKRLGITIVIASAIIALAIASTVYILITRNASAPSAEENSALTSPSSTEPPAQPAEAYEGQVASIADTFSIKVPNGWKASISESASFRAIMFARPNRLSSLVYDASSSPAIDRLGIPSWSGLTEHFFVTLPTASRQFDQADHLRVSSDPFTFDDGHIGQKFTVLKDATEARKWGGLQKDAEWQGRTYIYEKDGKRIEAHLAVYASTVIDLNLYENVVKTIQP